MQVGNDDAATVRHQHARRAFTEARCAAGDNENLALDVHGLLWLEDGRIIGSVVHVEPPSYQGITVIARLRAGPRADADRVRVDAVAALHRYFDPLVGGPEGTGWPWGRPAQAGDAFGVLQRIHGVDVVEDVRLFGANPVTGERGEATARLELAANSLVFSYEHQVRVVTP